MGGKEARWVGHVMRGDSVGGGLVRGGVYALVYVACLVVWGFGEWMDAWRDGLAEWGLRGGAVMWKIVAHDGDGDGVLACDCFSFVGSTERGSASDGITWGGWVGS